MEEIFTATEVRVLGCLIEKECTTPEVYPLTLNSLTRACNQKSNRDPVTELDEASVLDALQSLNKRMLVSVKSAADSRALKYSHRLRDRRAPEFDFIPAELAVLATLFLRGAQTPGEIRTRCDRLHQFADMQSLLDTLQRLAARTDGPYVKQLPRQPGQKESRYVHLFFGPVDDATYADVVADANPQTAGSSARLAALEDKVSELEQKLADLEQRLTGLI